MSLGDFVSQLGGGGECKQYMVNIHLFKWFSPSLFPAEIRNHFFWALESIHTKLCNRKQILIYCRVNELKLSSRKNDNIRYKHVCTIMSFFVTMIPGPEKIHLTVVFLQRCHLLLT